MAKSVVLVALAAVAALPGMSAGAGWNVLKWGGSRPSLAAAPPIPYRGRGVVDAAAVSPAAAAPAHAGMHAGPPGMAADAVQSAARAGGRR